MKEPMVTLRVITGAALLVLGASLPAHKASAEVQQGLHVYSACRGVNVHFCQGYITAIADEMSGGVEFRNYRACIPEDATPSQLRLIVTKWLEDHPKYRHDPGAGLVAEALANEFPCQ
jgi:hypothetical protein